MDTLVSRALRRLGRRADPILVVVGAGILVSTLSSLALHRSERREVAQHAADLAHEQVETLQVSIRRSLEVLHSIAALHRVQGGISRPAFGRFVEDALARQPELQALSWNPRVPAARRAELEKAAMLDGLADFAFTELDPEGRRQRARERPEYVPVYFIEPAAENTAALGYDLASDPSRRITLEKARDSGEPTATAPVQLAQGPAHQAGFLVLLPVFADPPPVSAAERSERLSGFAVAVFRVNDLVSAAVRELQARGIHGALFDESPTGERLFELPSDSRPSRPWRGPGGGREVAWLQFAGRRWALVYTWQPERLAAHGPRPSWIVLAAGLAFTALAATHLTRGRRLSRRVAAANAALCEEIAVRKKAEAEAEAANQAKSDFLASMSHEIRTPLNAILGYAQLMERDSRISADQRDATAGISSSGHHLLGLINEILDLSKIEAGRMDLNLTDFDLADLAHGLTATFRPLCARKRIRFRLEWSSSVSSQVHGDEGKLRQILFNLLGNAVKFTRSGEVYFHFDPTPGGRWLFEVIDTGLGIPDEEREHIFEPFHQGAGAAHQGGTGLGLAIARRQVELLGGRLELQSERGIGSRFHFSIPLPPSRAPQPEPHRGDRLLAPGQHVRVLVVDDHADNRNVLRGMLESAGVEVTVACDGREALAAARAARCQMVFLDLLLPGEDGAEIARRLQDDPECGRPRIVVHTASALPRHREEAFAAGCVGFLTKPIACERLYECLECHLGVRFERVSGPSVPDATPDPDPDPGPDLHPNAVQVRLPGTLCDRLAVAAELHSMTALKAALQELRQQGPQAAQLAEQIRWLMRSFDMHGIQRLLANAVPTDDGEEDTRAAAAPARAVS